MEGIERLLVTAVADLLLGLQAIYTGHCRGPQEDEISSPAWPEDFKECLFSRLPQAIHLRGHNARLVKGETHYHEGVLALYLLYQCCGLPVSMFIMRREDVNGFMRERGLLAEVDDLARLRAGGINFLMMDLGEVIVCGISSHEITPLLDALRGCSGSG
jgi:hypothetical protein